MGAFTEENVAVLDRHRIPISAVFDATGMGRSQYQRLMKPEGKLVAVGVTPCRRAGHTIRTRPGHCLVCSPACFGFLDRHYRNAHVYLAGSKVTGLFKIGSAASARERIAILNDLNYGGVDDWRILIKKTFINAGAIEFALHKILARYQYPRKYFREGQVVYCREIFKFSLDDVYDLIEPTFGFLEVIGATLEWKEWLRT